MSHRHTPALFTWTLACAAAVVSTTGCDARDPDRTDEIDQADTGDAEDLDDAVDLEDADDDEIVTESVAALPRHSNLDFEYLEIPFSGVCGFEDGPAMGTIELLVFDDLTVDGLVHYSWLSDAYPVATTIDRDGVIEVRQRTALSGCTFTVDVDFQTLTTSGTWDCGPRCFGAWPSVDR